MKVIESPWGFEIREKAPWRPEISPSFIGRRGDTTKIKPAISWILRLGKRRYSV